MLERSSRAALRPSLQRYLLKWILGSVALFTLLETGLSLQNALISLNSAHDRLLRATAHAIGDSLHIDTGRQLISVPFALLEAYENTGGSQLLYRVSGFNGELLAGDPKLPKWTQPLADSALMSVHDISIEIEGKLIPLRMAVLRQPMESMEGRGIALIQVAETLDVRSKTARDLLLTTLVRQGLMLLLIALLIVWVVNRAVRPFQAVRLELLQRDERSLAPLLERGTKEIQPVMDAMNALLGHLQAARNQQQRLIANAAHQLRTPLAVLKTQLQSARSGDVPAEQVVQDLEKTVDRATNLTNQLLSLAKVEQMRQRGVRQRMDVADSAKEAALELSPLITAKRLDFSLQSSSCMLTADPWLVGELIRNILLNAIRFSPNGASLAVDLEPHPSGIRLQISDQGPGIEDDLLEKVFEPFTSASAGSGLGLAIAKEIATALNAQIRLHNRMQDQRVQGLDAEVIFVIS